MTKDEKANVAVARKLETSVDKNIQNRKKNTNIPSRATY